MGTLNPIVVYVTLIPTGIEGSNLIPLSSVEGTMIMGDFFF